MSTKKKRKEQNAKNSKKRYNIRLRGNVCLKCRDRNCERKIIEVIKNTDSMRKEEEHFQGRHGEKWTLIDTEAREGFSNCTQIKIKCAAGINVHGENIKLANKGNAHAVCPTCDELETWKHVTLCDK